MTERDLVVADVHKEIESCTNVASVISVGHLGDTSMEIEF